MRRANKSGAIRGGAPLRAGGSEAAPAAMEGLVFAGHPGGPLKVQPGKVRPAPRAGLNALENWMQAVITHPGGIADGERSTAARRNIDRGPGTIEQLISPSRN
ncbi:MAG: hypothetical protein K8T20_16860, partial [Planctomycetes bacterium]|nr:hypothetical protein [Planctomycetota bacterium]